MAAQRKTRKAFLGANAARALENSKSQSYKTPNWQQVAGPAFLPFPPLASHTHPKLRLVAWFEHVFAAARDVWPRLKERMEEKQVVSLTLKENISG